MQMEKGKFSQNTTRFKDKSKNIQPVVINTELVNSLIGGETNKAPSVAAVNEGLAGKLDATLPSEVTTEYAYMISPYGNSIRRMSGVENTQGNIPSYRRVDETNRGDQGGTINVTTPKYPYNAANMKYVDDGLAKKLDSKAQSLTGMWFYGIEANKDVAKRGVTSPSAWNVPLYATNGVLYTNDPMLATSSEKEKACANVWYVDGKISELEHGLYNALGAQYTFEYIPFSGPMASISENVLPFIYVEKIGEATGYNTMTGENEGPVQIMGLEFRDDMSNPIGGIAKSDEGQFVKFPEGAKSIYVLQELSGDSIRVDVLLKVQVKIGG